MAISAGELPLLTFPTSQDFAAWLTSQPDAAGAWLRFAKQGAPEPTLSKSDAIDTALAHRWIDGQIGRVDAHYFKTRFTPRLAKSAWSQVNQERVERLTAAGRMTARGQMQVEQAKADGRCCTASTRPRRPPSAPPRSPKWSPSSHAAGPSIRPGKPRRSAPQTLPPPAPSR
jgi:uncharacterized protein YdeI (YjbR/CyaY-like superfamily)